jgi:hypothetical protein
MSSSKNRGIAAAGRRRHDPRLRRGQRRLFIVKQNRNVPVVKAREALDTGRFRRLILGTVRALVPGPGLL